MQAVANITSNYVGYVKCGEILKSQKSFQDPYILRCIQCDEIYLLLESFILHLNDICKRTCEAKTDTQAIFNCSEEAAIITEPLECEEPSLTLEDSNAQMEDPLIVVKNETGIDESCIKIEPSNCCESVDFNSGTSTSLSGTKYLNNVDDISQDGAVSSLDTEVECEVQEKYPEEIELIKKTLDNNGVTSSFVNNFMKSEENLTVLIAAFKDQPQLWNKTLPHFRNKLRRREYMIKIAQDLIVNHNIKINARQVSAIIVHLYRKYQDDMHKFQEKNHSEISHVRPWYLTQISFIQPHLESYSLEILDANYPKLLPQQIVQILEIYKNLPHLWNTNLVENHCQNKRHESILEMLKQLETDMNLKINENLLEQYLRTIHKIFSREKRQLLNYKSDRINNTDETNGDYYEHLKFLYDHVPPLKCCVCGAESISPLHFKIHTSSHDGTIPFSCSLCNKTFKRVNVYTSHAKRHFEDLNYICKECGKKFVNYTNLRLHMRIHTGDKPYCCEMCGDSFRFLQTLSNHRRRHEKRYLHTCKICSQGFYSKMRHDDHMNSHMNIRPHLCDICNKAFITKRALKQHKVVHEDVRNYACKLCGKTFKHKTGVNQHMRTHNVATTEDRGVV